MADSAILTLVDQIFSLMLWPFRQFSVFLVIPVAIVFCCAMLRLVFNLIQRRYKR